MKSHFECRINHNSDTIRILFKTKYYIYEKKRMLIRMAAGASLAVIGLLANLPIAAQAALLMAGSWLLVSRDFPSANRADKAIEARQGNFPAISYSFAEDGAKLKDGNTMLLKYDQFHRLIEDKGYLYLFLDKDSVCMIDKSTIKPGSVEEFMAYVKEKTGREWERGKSIFSMNLYDLLQATLNYKKG